MSIAEIGPLIVFIVYIVLLVVFYKKDSLPSPWSLLGAIFLINFVISGRFYFLTATLIAFCIIIAVYFIYEWGD